MHDGDLIAFQQRVFTPLQPMIEVGEDFDALVFGQFVALQFQTELIAKVGKKQGEVVAFGQIFHFRQTDGG